MKPEAVERFYPRKGVALLWLALIAGPAAWAIHLGVSYNLVLYICRTGAVWLLHLTTIVSLAIVAAGGWLAWRNWRLAGKPLDTEGGGMEGRTRFMALSALASCAAFALLIAVEGVPNFIVEPCG